jgi:hypothetical protein
MTVTKHAQDFIINWFVPAKADIGQYVAFILLAYIMISMSKPEAICDLKTHLPNPLTKLKIYINNFNVNNKASSKGNEYQMYTKVGIGTNAFGEDFSQLMEDLKGFTQV